MAASTKGLIREGQPFIMRRRNLLENAATIPEIPYFPELNENHRAEEALRGRREQAEFLILFPLYLWRELDMLYESTLQEYSVQDHQTHKARAILLMVLSATFFSFMSMFVKLSGDLPSMEKAVFRNLVSLIIAFTILKSRKLPLWGLKENRKFLLMRSIIGGAAIILYFYSIDHLILADSAMLNKLSPFFVLIFAALFLKNPIRPFHIVSLVFAMGGAMLIIKPGFNFTSMMPALAGLTSAFMAGITYTIISYLGGKENSYTIVFFFSLVSTIICLPFLFFDPVMPSPMQLLTLIAAGSMAAGGQILLTAAYRFAPAGEVSIYQYSQIVVSSILGIFVFSELPDYLSIIGYVLIFIGGYLMYLRGRNSTRKIPEK